jgi:hypothetical protein
VFLFNELDEGGGEFYRMFNWKFKQAHGQSIRATSQRGTVADPVRSYTEPVNNGNRFLSDSCTYFALNPASPRVRWVWRDVLLFRGTCFSFLQFEIGAAIVLHQTCLRSRNSGTFKAAEQYLSIMWNIHYCQTYSSNNNTTVNLRETGNVTERYIWWIGWTNRDIFDSAVS